MEEDARVVAKLLKAQIQSLQREREERRQQAERDGEVAEAPSSTGK